MKIIGFRVVPILAAVAMAGLASVQLTRAEEPQDTELLLQSAVAANPTAQVVIDAGGTLVMASDEARAITGQIVPITGKAY